MKERNDQFKIFYIAKGFCLFRWVGVIFSLFLAMSHGSRAQSLYQIVDGDANGEQVRWLSILQDAAFVEFMVHRDGNLRERGQVGYSLQDLSAESGEDPSNFIVFDHVNGVVPFDIGIQKATIRVPIPDHHQKGPGSPSLQRGHWFAGLKLELHPMDSRLDGVGPAAHFRLAYAKQESPDVDPRRLEIVPGYDFVTEAGDRSFIRMMRHGSVEGILRGKVTFSSGGALAGEDFVGESMLFQFAPGQTTLDVPVKLIDDSMWEGSEFFEVRVTLDDPDEFEGFREWIVIRDDEFFLDLSFQPEGKLKNVVSGLGGSSFWATSEGRLVRCDLSGRLDRTFAPDLPNGFMLSEYSVRLPLDGGGILVGPRFTSAGNRTLYRLRKDGARTGSFYFDGELVCSGWDTLNGGAYLLFQKGEKCEGRPKSAAGGS